MQVFRRNAEDLQVLLADKGYSWSDLREECREESMRPVIKHKEHNGLKKAHNARIDDDVYHQRWMCEPQHVRPRPFIDDFAVLDAK